MKERMRCARRKITSASFLQTIKFDAINNANLEKEVKVYSSKLDRKNIKKILNEREKKRERGFFLL